MRGVGIRFHDPIFGKPGDKLASVVAIVEGLIKLVVLAGRLGGNRLVRSDNEVAVLRDGLPTISVRRSRLGTRS